VRWPCLCLYRAGLLGASQTPDGAARAAITWLARPAGVCKAAAPATELWPGAAQRAEVLKRETGWPLGCWRHVAMFGAGQKGGWCDGWQCTGREGCAGPGFSVSMQHRTHAMLQQANATLALESSTPSCVEGA
jgi:hypothetical protein